MGGFGQGFDVEAALRLAEQMGKPKRSVTRPPATSPFEIDKAALAAAVAGTPWAPPASPFEPDEAAIEAALAGTEWGDPVPSPAAPPPPAALTNDQWMDQMVDQGRFVGDLTDPVNAFNTVPKTTTTVPAEMTQAAFDAGEMVADPRIAMREQAATDFLSGGGTQQQLDDFLNVVGTEDWFNHLAAQPEVMAEIDPLTNRPRSDVVNAALGAIQAGQSPTLPWMDSPEFQQQYTAPTITNGGDGGMGPGGMGPGGETPFGGPTETKPEMTPVGNFVDSQTEALDVIQRRLDEITNATNAARDSGIEQIDIIQGEAQKQLDATFANQYTVLDPMTGEPLKEGEMDRLLATWTDEKSKSKTARAADKAVIGNLALNEGIVSSQMEFDTIDTLYGDQIDAQYQYIDSLYRIGKLAKDDRDAMLTNIMAGYKSDLTNKAIEIILGAEIDTADRRAEVREDALSARDVAEYLGADANAIFGGMRGDIPIGEMAYQTGERIAGEEFTAGESELDRLAQGINPATGRPYGFMTSGPYAGMTIGEANAARQEKDLVALQMEFMQAEEQRAVDAVDLEAERYEDMWREGAFYDRQGNLIEGVGKGWYDIGINPATGDPWTTDDDVYGEPIPTGFYAADFDDVNLTGVDVIEGEYWMTPSQFAQLGPILEAKAAKDADSFGDLQDPQMSITAAVLQLASPAKYTEWQNAVNTIYLLDEGGVGSVPEGTPAEVVWSQVISRQASTDPEAAKVWANLTNTKVMGKTSQGVPFIAFPDGSVTSGEPVDNNFMPGQSVRGPDQGLDQGD